jgi:hypothetical protein
LYHLNKRSVFDKEEVGTRWFFNRDKPSTDIFWLRDEILETMRQLHCPIAGLLRSIR